ncbi:nucleotidyltransferase domain-containing protein [Candidatus Woesearchaeota archaeon]|nr:nucleotidyltransferase domain-containing protein [Candidatus Woesearchaeota archaeon]
MKSLTPLLKKVLAEIKPSAQEQKEFSSATASFLKKLNAELKDAKATLGGSGANGTWLSGNHDADIFVAYDYKQYAEKSSALSDILEPILNKLFPKQKKQRLHGSRDYFQLQYENFTFEVIPILQIKKAEEAKNITDVSVLHSIWVNKEAKSIKEEILLAKQFCKAQLCYGAESHIGGLSGHVIEILLVNYSSFDKFLKAAIRWGLQEVIDPEDHYKNRDVMFALNKSKLQSPLIVIDPVDKNRNAAAAFTEEKFYHLKEVAREYLKKPSEAFFKKKKIDWEEEAKKKKLNLVLLELEPLEGKRDVVGVKLGKIFDFLKKKIASFQIKQTHWDWDTIAFLLEKRELPAEEVRQGPPLELTEHVKQFKKMHKETFVKDGKVWAKVAVKHPRLEDFVKAVMKEKYVLEKVKKVKKVKVE